MKKNDRKRVSKESLELAAPPEAPGPARETFSGIDALAGHLKPKRKRVMISICLDADVLSWYRSRGKGYQSYIGELLAAWKRQQESQIRTREHEGG